MALEYKTVTCIDQTAPVWEIAYISLPSQPRHITEMRLQMRDFLRATSFPDDEIADIEMAVGEACTNALKHGSPKGELDEIKMKCMVNESKLIVEITDNGYGFDPDSISAPTPDTLSEGGMGVFLMRALMDQVEFEFDQGTTVRLAKYRNTRNL